MASSTPNAVPDWQLAQRGSSSLRAQLNKIRTQTGSGLDISAFDAVDVTMENIRLSCVKVIFSDLKYANDVGAESMLWQSHSLVNAEYRNVLGRLKGSSQAVERRKIEKAYHKFLRVSIAFYRGYIQRLNACYEIPELQRLAKGLEAEAMPTDNRVSQVSEGVRRHIVESCYATLIRIGDLARYKCQAKQRKGGYETPLAYYGLAQDLKPKSGFAAHQMGMISIDEGNSLNMIYYFYRSLATKHPHPNAKANLESTFKTSQQSRNSSSKGVQDPFQGFIDRFIHLHGLFSRGQSTSNVEELENQVIKEIQTTSERTAANHVLFKMSLINFAAHEVACTRHSETSTEAAYLFSRSTLRFNVQFVSTLLATLEAALLAPARNRNGTNANQLSTVQMLVPILRTYCMWLAVHREEVFKRSQSVREVGPQMTERLIRVFTLLVKEINQASQLSSCPYLLSEDLEVLGLQPFSKDRVPDPCRAYCLEDGSVKPHFQEGMAVLDIARSTEARILDILRCAYFFAECPTAPLTYQADEEQGLVFVPALKETQTRQPTSPAIPLTETETLALQTEVAQPQDAQNGTTATTQTDVLVPISRVMGNPEQEEELSEHDQHMQQTVVDMLSPLLRSSTPELTHRHESSYGIHTETANDLLASLNFDLRNPSGNRSPEHQPSPWTWPDQPAVLAGRHRSPSSGRPIRSQRHSDGPSSEIISGLDRSLDSYTSNSELSPNLEDFGIRYATGSFRPPNVQTEHRADLLRAFNDDRSPTLPSHRSASNGAIGYAQNRFTNLASESQFQHYGQPLPAFSSGMSAFSHPSSLYQGTPLNRTLSDSRVAKPPDNVAGDGREGSDTVTRQMHMLRYTSNSDAAVLNSALQGRQQARRQGYH